MTVTEREGTEPEHVRGTESRSLWRNPDYLLLWSGQIISMVGGGISQLAFPLLVLSLTGSPAQAGLVGALRSLPYFLFSLPAGALIDRWDRRWVMILSDAGRAITMTSIPLALATGHLTVAQLYLTSLIEGTLFVFFSLAETACLPQVVGTEQLPAASAQHVVTWGVTTLLGPPLGGVLYSVNHSLPFLADALSYSASIFSLLFIRTRFQEERSAIPGTLWAEVLEGVLWLWRQPLVRSMAVLTGGLNLMLPGSVLLLIVIAQRRHATPAAIGLLLAVIGVGQILGALLSTRIQKRFSFGQVIIATYWLFTVLWPLYALASSLLALGAVAVLIGLVDPVYDVVQYSYRLVLIPDQLQGRVNSAFRLVALGANSLGMALTGVFIQVLNVVPTVLVFAACLICLALFATGNPHIRNAPALR